MPLSEPMTLATDYLIAVVSFILYLKVRVLFRQSGTQALHFWSFAFLATAFSALFGGSFHGFSEILSLPVLNGLWDLTLWSLGLVVFFMCLGTFHMGLSAKYLRLATIIITVILLSYLGRSYFYKEFLLVILNYGSALIFMLIFHGTRWLNTKDSSYAYMVWGVVISFIAAGIQQSNLALHEHFNHNDLYHLVQLAGLLLMYKGVSLFRQTGERP